MSISLLPPPTTISELTLNMPAHDLVVGDVLMIAGKSVFSRLVRLIEGCPFDHVAIVVPPNPDHPMFGIGGQDPRMNEIWITDIGFPGGRWQPLSAYDDTVLALAVRRHRIPGWREPVAKQSIAVALSAPAYAWDRLLFLTLVGVTRWSTELCKMGTKDANAFVRGLYELVGAIDRQGDQHLDSRKVCSDLIVGACDVFAGNPGIDDTYYGLVTPVPEHHGLLWWAAGMNELSEFLYARPPARGPSVLEYLFKDNAPTAYRAPDLLEEAADGAGVEFRGMHAIPEQELRRIVVTTAAKAFSEFIAPPPATELRRAADSQRMALFLLDQAMKHRIVTTPADIARTPSLYDAGTVDLGSVRWQAFV